MTGRRKGSGRSRGATRGRTAPRAPDQRAPETPAGLQEEQAPGPDQEQPAIPWSTRLAGLLKRKPTTPRWTLRDPADCVVLPDFLRTGEISIPRHDLLVVALGVVIGIAYLPAMLWGDFVWDDAIINTSESIRQWGGIFRIWFTPSDGGLIEVHYWPMVYSTFWLEHKLWGYDPTGYHVVNVLMHFANTWLLWLILARLKVPGSWFVAMLFAIHPTHVDSVAWVIERKDVLSALMYLYGVWFWVRYLEAPNRKDYLLTMLFLVLGMLSKSIVATLPVAMLIIQWWQRGRLTSTDIVKSLPFFAVAIAISIFDVWFLRTHAETPYFYTFFERILIAARSVWFYFGKIVYPVDFAVIYPYWDESLANPMNWLYLVSGGVLLGLLWWFRGRIGRGPLAGALFFCVTLSPVLGFVDHFYMDFAFVADRFQYLASIGPIAVLGSLAVVLARRFTDALREAPEGSWQPFAVQWGAPGLGAVLILFLSVGTWRQSEIYEGPLVFFGHVVSHNPEARGAYGGLSGALYNNGRLMEAMDTARIAVDMYPKDPNSLNNLGLALRTMDKFAEAEELYREALVHEARNASARKNLINMLREQERYEESVEQTLQLLRWYNEGPEGFRALFNAGKDLIELERFPDAERFFRKALEIEPGHPEATNRLIETLAAQDRHDEVLALGSDASDRNPNDESAFINMGVAMWNMERYDEAETHYRQALELNPDSKTALKNFIVLLQRTERKEEAIELIDHFLELYPDEEEALAFHVGAGTDLMELRRYEEAQKHLLRASELDTEDRSLRFVRAEALTHLDRFDEASAVYFALIDEHTELGDKAWKEPQIHIAHANLAMLLKRLERPDEAIMHYRTSLKDIPGNQAVLKSLITLLQEEARYDEMRAAIDELLKAHPEDSEMFGLAGYVLMSTGHEDQAETHLRRAIELAPGNVTTLQNLAEVLRTGRRYEEAIEVFNAVLEVRPDYALAFVGLADSLRRVGRPEDALEAIDQALNLEPGLAPAATVRGQILQRLGRSE